MKFFKDGKQEHSSINDVVNDLAFGDEDEYASASSVQHNSIAQAAETDDPLERPKSIRFIDEV